jgi:toxin ParE1/3/4
MKMRVIWTQPASMNLRDLHEYVADSSFEAADRQVALLLNATSTLTDFPEKGRSGRRRGTRELVVSGTPYIVAYRSRVGAIEILTVVHGARRWPRSFGD